MTEMSTSLKMPIKRVDIRLLRRRSFARKIVHESEGILESILSRLVNRLLEFAPKKLS